MDSQNERLIDTVLANMDKDDGTNIRINHSTSFEANIQKEDPTHWPLDLDSTFLGRHLDLEQEAPMFDHQPVRRSVERNQPRMIKRKSKAIDKESNGDSSLDIKDVRRERNKELARESRRRKKEYIQNLEQKVKGLEDEIRKVN